MRSCHGHSVVGAGLRYRLKKLQLHVAAGAFRSTRCSLKLKVLRIRAATYIALARARSSPAAVITVRVTVVADEPVFTANDLY